MEATYVRLLQQSLLGEGFRPGPVDGVLGDRTYAAAEKALKERITSLPADWPDWATQRKAISYLTLLCRERDIEVGAIDGFWGPQTGYAAGGSDTTLIVWPSTEALVEMLCENVRRNLYESEWRQFVGPDIPYELTCPNLP